MIALSDAVLDRPHVQFDDTPLPTTLEKLAVRSASFWYGEKQALFDITLDIPAQSVAAFIGLSGCGRHALRLLNRMNDLSKARGLRERTADGKDIYERGLDVVQPARRVGMVFQKSNPFPKTIYENVAYGPPRRAECARLDYLVERSQASGLVGRGERPAARRRWNSPGATTTASTRARDRPGSALMDEPAVPSTKSTQAIRT